MASNISINVQGGTTNLQPLEIHIQGANGGQNIEIEFGGGVPNNNNNHQQQHHQSNFPPQQQQHNQPNFPGGHPNPNARPNLIAQRHQESHFQPQHQPQPVIQQQQPIYQQQPVYQQPQPVYQQQPQVQPIIQQQPVYQQPQPVYQQQPQPQPVYQQQPMVQQPLPQQHYVPQQQQQPVYQHPPQNHPIQQTPQQPEKEKAKKDPKEGYNRLDGRDGIYIEQSVDVLKMMAGTNGGNEYFVFPLSGDQQDKKGKALFRCKEQSEGNCASYCVENFFAPGSRPFHMRVSLNDNDEKIDNEGFLMLERPKTCTIGCFCRPELKVSHVADGGTEYIGKIVNPVTCCWSDALDVYDAHDNLKYSIVATCQLGLCCTGCCGSCSEVLFEVKSGDSDNIVSSITKKGTCSSVQSNEQTTFALNFPKGASNPEKALLMSAGLFLDYMYFEKKHSK